MNIITLPIAAYLGASLFLYLFQEQMIYFPEKEITYTPKSVGLNYEEVEFLATDQIELFGWYVPSEKNGASTIIFCHGNAGNISNRVQMLRAFHDLGVNVFIFDYRGFGKSKGNPSEIGLYKDAIGAWSYLVNKRKERPEKIIIYGRSLGGAVATYLAKERASAGLILESTFTSLVDVGKEKFPFFPISLMAKSKYDTLSFITKVDVPILVIHSPNDEIIPFDHGQTIFHHLKVDKQFIEIEGDHNSGYFSSKKIYISGVKGFLDKITSP